MDFTSIKNFFEEHKIKLIIAVIVLIIVLVYAVGKSKFTPSKNDSPEQLDKQIDDLILSIISKQKTGEPRPRAQLNHRARD